MNDNQPAIPVPAATILMLRDTPDGLEVFMVVRHHEIDFASGALVFPGGKADPSDFDPELRKHTDGAFEDDNLCAIQVAAIRESFEECGILLARVAGDIELIDGGTLASLEHYRDPINAGELTILDFVKQENLRLACDRLTHFAHWITPPMVPKRFDTHFFLARAPEDHIATHDGHESVDSVWIRPADVLAEAESGERTVIFPTLRNVEKLARYTSSEAAINGTATQGPPVTVLPWTEKRNDATYLCIPPDAGYQISEWQMPDRKS